MKRLENLLKNYKEIDDFIIFGSAVKGKNKPNDIDVAVITEKKELDFVAKINQELGEGIHIELVKPSSLLKTRLSLNLLMEGYSVSKKDYLHNLLGLEPIKMFIYDLKGFSRSKKALFSMALTKLMNSFGGKRLAPGAVIIPIGKSESFNDFLDSWQIKYKTKEYTLF